MKSIEPKIDDAHGEWNLLSEIISRPAGFKVSHESLRAISVEELRAIIDRYKLQGRLEGLEMAANMCKSFGVFSDPRGFYCAEFEMAILTKRDQLRKECQLEEVDPIGDKARATDLAVMELDRLSKTSEPAKDAEGDEVYESGYAKPSDSTGQTDRKGEG